MAETMKRVECGDTNCDFAAQSPDEQEVVHAFMEHEKSAHNKNISESEARAKMSTVQPEQNQQSKQQPERDGQQDLRQTRNPNQKQDSKKEQSNNQGQTQQR